MKVLGKHIERDGSGRVSIIPEEDEDMYHLLNLIEEGDHVRAPAVRRVQNESSTGSMESHRVRTNLTIQVTKVNFDATGSSAPPDPSAANAANDIATQEAGSSTAGALGGGGGGAAGEGATLQVSGRVVEENAVVKMGAYHTLVSV